MSEEIGMQCTMRGYFYVYANIKGGFDFEGAGGYSSPTNYLPFYLKYLVISLWTLRIYIRRIIYSGKNSSVPSIFCLRAELHSIAVCFTHSLLFPILFHLVLRLTMVPSS